ncbi:NAD(P)(+) transhydrogenase (Re/Si-specific) subunit beta [Thermomicrobiaceae bacterium CFH 74404]|uniref:NAD(P) transhydrogenase subunit beta n=1 Tax=Thermalbibacter longus TaxID=2951981 RepID=A0AA41WCD1_9BACT|nr:NAD(P)(+) transhydrogenase (Re/Si-specific) subunit beta [Thermalbibacter longus]MCM8748388.1 NAD(P)(+) transhydrogenase (Re/Si-specific) subunit beta [Thermalbibacter longus]
MIESYREALIDLAYLVSAVALVFGLKRMSAPRTARSGNQIAAAALLLAVAVTLLDPHITWGAANIAVMLFGIGVGTVASVYLARIVPMTAMPQMVALFNGMGGGTAAVVSVAEFQRFAASGAVSVGEAVSVAFGTTIGSIALTGSLIAFAKLQEVMTGRPVRFPLQLPVNVAAFLGIVALWVWLLGLAGGVTVVWLLFALALVFGVLLVLPVGGADMPVVIAVLNSMTGLAAAATGFVLDNQILIVAGALVGASGSLLTILMSRAMNRSLANVMFGAFRVSGRAAAVAEAKPIREITAEDAAVLMAYANEVIVVPGYGLAVAQAQHQVRELADELEKRGVEVKFAIHPVAGRMPGHMNVLLAEANVPYDQLFEMEQINEEFQRADVALVVGANDVVNPAARSDPSSPIYGMPILNVDQARNVIVLKRSMRPGFAGIENELFHMSQTRMLFGDARESLMKLIEAVKAA